MPTMLQARTLDADELPLHPRSFEIVLKDALLKEFPVASVVDKVDDKFLHLLETMAALDVDGSLQSQPVQIFSDISHAPICAATDLGCLQMDRLSHAA